MSEQLAESIERVTAAIRRGEHADYAAALALVREAVGRLSWGTMTYRCEQCAFEWEVWLSLGVEGPPALRDAGAFVASPFTLSRCPAWPGMQSCPGQMSHVRFADDREFEPTLIPDDAPRFVLPVFMASGERAELAIPTPALIRARRFHHDAADR